MANISTIIEQLETLNTFKAVTEAYEEIAVMRMQKVRKSVISARLFMERISDVYVDVTNNYHTYLSWITKPKETGKATFTRKNKNKKAVSVFLAANMNLYGDIVMKVWSEFLTHIQTTETDVVIVGKVGKRYMERSDYSRTFQFFDVQDTGYNDADLESFIEHINQYEKVHVFHGKFNNLVNQTAAMTNVTGDYSVEKIQEKSVNQKKAHKDEMSYEFEPSIERIYEIFENQIFTAIVKQTITEAELARHASRVTAMEEAHSNIIERKEKMRRRMLIYQKRQDNKKVIERVAGLHLKRRKV